jgi:AraC-like DNA-binding protein
LSGIIRFDIYRDTYLQMNYLKVLYLLGFLQGSIISVILFKKNPQRLQNRLIAAFIFLLSLGCMFDGTVITITNPYLMWLWNSNQFLIGPLLYMYVYYFNSPGMLKNTGWLHFIPFLFFKVLLFPISPFQGIFTESNPFVQQLINTLPSIHILIYSILSLLKTSDLKNELSNYISNSKPFKIAWLRAIIAASAVAAILVIFSKLIQIQSPLISEQFYGVAYLLAVMSIYILSINALNYPYWFDHFEKNLSTGISPVQNFDPAKTTTDKYKKSGLDYSQIEEISKRVINLMEDKKPYLDPDLSLVNLAALMDVPAHQLTQVINIGLNMNFHLLVNGYRVNEAKKILINPKYANYTIVANAFHCGFNSKSSFNRIFKEYTGITPSEFRNNHLS